MLTASGTQMVSLSSLAAWTPIAANVDLSQPFTVSDVPILTLNPGQSDQVGDYTVFLVAVTAGALRDSAVQPSEVLAAGVAPFRLLHGAVGLTDANGRVVLRVAGREFPFRITDQPTGLPLAGFAVGFALVEVGTPTSAPLEAREIAPEAEVAIKVSNWLAKTFDAARAAEGVPLPSPAQEFVSVSRAVGAIAAIVKVVDQIPGVPISERFAGQLGFSAEPISKDEAIKKITEGAALDTIFVLGLSLASLPFTGGISLVGSPWGVGFIQVAAILDLQTAIEREDGEPGERCSRANRGKRRFQLRRYQHRRDDESIRFLPDRLGIWQRGRRYLLRVGRRQQRDRRNADRVRGERADQRPRALRVRRRFPGDVHDHRAILRERAEVGGGRVGEIRCRRGGWRRARGAWRWPTDRRACPSAGSRTARSRPGYEGGRTRPRP